MTKKTVIGTIRQPINLVSAFSGSVIEIEYEDGDELVHYVDDEGTILHNPNFPDLDCPCYDDDDEQGDTSEYAATLHAYQSDFFSIALVGNNMGGVCFERQIMDRVLRGAA